MLTALKPAPSPAVASKDLKRPYTRRRDASSHQNDTWQQLVCWKYSRGHDLSPHIYTQAEPEERIQLQSSLVRSASSSFKHIINIELDHSQCAIPFSRRRAFGSSGRLS